MLALIDRIAMPDTHPVSAAAVVAAVSRSALLALLCLFAASDVRRHAALVQMAAVGAAIEALTIAIVLSLGATRMA